MEIRHLPVWNAKEFYMQEVRTGDELESAECQLGSALMYLVIVFTGSL